MATSDETLTPSLASGERSRALAREWRGLGRAATIVAVLTAPAIFLWLHEHEGTGTWWAIAWTFLIVIAFRGLVDLILRRLIPWPSLFGVEEDRVREEDVVSRRRAWFWRFWWRLAFTIVLFLTVFWVIRLLLGHSETWWDSVTVLWHFLSSHGGQFLQYVVILPLFFLINFA